MESFGENEVNYKEIEELAFIFVDDNIPKEKFRAKSELEKEIFNKAYDKALNEKNGYIIDEEDPEVKLAA